MPAIGDSLRLALAADVTADCVRAARLSLATSLRPALAGEHLWPQVPPGEPVEADEVRPLLNHRRTVIEEWLSGFVGRYSAAHWLYALRRVPRAAFLPEHVSEFLQRAKLADVVTAHSARHEAVTLTPGGRLEYGGSTAELVEALCDLIAGVTMLSTAQDVLARAELGPTFALTEGVGEVIHSEEVGQAIALYNSRVNPHGAQLYRLGTNVVERDATQTSPFPVLSVGHDDEERTIYPPLRPGTTFQRPYLIDTAFLPQPAAIDRLTALTQNPLLANDRWWDNGAALVLTVARLALERCNTFEEDYNDVLSTGCFALRRAAFAQAIERVLATDADHLRRLLPGATWPEDGEEAIEALAAWEVGWRPWNAPPAVRTDSDVVLVDLLSTWHRLDRLLRFETDLGGASGRARGKVFEDHVQESLIDPTRWKPSPRVREARERRTLKLNGQTVTDLDAAGDFGGTALLVSCKARLFTDANALMDGRKIWNDQDELAGYIRDWRRKVARLDANRVGGNYDLRGFTKLVGVVCIPFTPFVFIGQATEEVEPGLRAAVSAYELGEWLRR